MEGCDNMAHVQQGDTVKVHYTGKLDDGTVFDTSQDRESLEFTLGKGQLIPGFEDAVIGMNPGQSKTVEIPSEQAYGPYHKEVVMEIPRDQFPENLNPEIDQQLQIQQENGQVFLVRVTDVEESTVTLDANHPLAGQDLTFDIQLIDIVE
jgi:FKBP-type peptidyl-prolyl cis-trans isomerase 2